jgi:hypothetical protein
MHTDLDVKFKHHPPRDDLTIRKHEEIRAACRKVAETVEATVPLGREQALALTKIEEAMFWANAGIARAHAGA